MIPDLQMVPKNLVPMEKWSPTNLVTFGYPQTKYSRDHLSMGTEFLGTICPGNQLGTNFVGAKCLGKI